MENLQNGPLSKGFSGEDITRIKTQIANNIIKSFHVIFYICGLKTLGWISHIKCHEKRPTQTDKPGITICLTNNLNKKIDRKRLVPESFLFVGQIQNVIVMKHIKYRIVKHDTVQHTYDFAKKNTQ